MFKGMEFHLSYIAKEISGSAIFEGDFSNSDFSATVSIEKTEGYQRLTMKLQPSDPDAGFTITGLYAEVGFQYTQGDRIFANGYQSWTDSREFFMGEKLTSMSRLARPLWNKYQMHKYGDCTFQKYSRKTGDFHGFTYSYIRNGTKYKFLGSLSEKNGFTIIEEHTAENRLIVRKDCKGLNVKGSYEAFDLIWTVGNENEVFDTWFELMGIAKPGVMPMTGWTSWYNYYQFINEEIILDNIDNFKALDKKIDIFQIDDGYQTFVGDWLSVDGNKFPKGMKHIADRIKENGWKAGIWLAPFACETDSALYRDKKDWILKDEKGCEVLAGCNWSRFYALDIYNPEVREYIREVFRVVLQEWGYDLVKLDFLYAVCLVPRKDKTRGQIMTEAMQFLRECVGDKLILGCGVPLGPAFGLVDYCRIGCDVSLDWDDKPFMRLMLRERVSTCNTIKSTIGRRALNGRAFMNDTDVFLLRDDNTMLTEDQKITLATVNRLFGSLLFTSDNINMYDGKKLTAFKNMIDLKERCIERVEHYENGLVEVIYIEEGRKHIALINLGKTEISYPSLFGKLTEVHLHDRRHEDMAAQGAAANSGDDEAAVMPAVKRMSEVDYRIRPYESRTFVISV
ncbi:MAG: glycosyl hydrolase [Clostridiales bacterium]|nr:glycosyl hydrolase [Clostridiales bacterium]